MISLYINMIAISFFVYGLPDIVRNLLALRKKNARIYDPLLTMFECFKCVAYWSTLIISGSFIIACQVMCVAYLIDKFILSRY